MPVNKEATEAIWSDVQVEDIYLKIGLSRNPFKANGNPPVSPSIPPYPEVYNKIIDFFKNFLRSKQSRGLVLLGDYGTGKTYHLRWIQELLGTRSEISIRVINVETPGLEPYDLVRQMLMQIGDQELARAIWTVVLPRLRDEIRAEGQRFFRKFADIAVKPKRGPQMEFVEEGFDVPLIDITEDNLRDYRNFLSAFDKKKVLNREKLRDWVLQLLYQRGPEGLAITSSTSIARELANLCCLSGAPALLSWERLTITTQKSLFTTQGEPEFLQTIMRLMVYAGTEYFVLLLDEFEKVPLMEKMTSKEMRRYLDTVRMLADKGWQTEDLPFAWVIASHDEAWSVVRDRLNQAMAERFPTEVNLLRSNDAEFARYLVSESLALVRRQPMPKGSVSPFPENFIDLIPPELRRTPRDLLVLCFSFVEAAIDAEPFPGEHITEEFVKKFLAQRYLKPLDGGHVEE